MFGLGPATKIYLAVDAVDMRKGFEGLYGLVRDRLGARSTERASVPVHQSHRTRLKALVWDGSGLWVCAKRLEKGRFRWPEANRRSVRHDAAGRVGDAGQRSGPDASTAAQELDAQGAGCIEIDIFVHRNVR